MHQKDMPKTLIVYDIHIKGMPSYKTGPEENIDHRVTTPSHLERNFKTLVVCRNYKHRKSTTIFVSPSEVGNTSSAVLCL